MVSFRCRRKDLGSPGKGTGRNCPVGVASANHVQAVAATLEGTDSPLYDPIRDRDPSPFACVSNVFESYAEAQTSTGCWSLRHRHQLRACMALGSTVASVQYGDCQDACPSVQLFLKRCMESFCDLERWKLSHIIRLRHWMTPSQTRPSGIGPR